MIVLDVASLRAVDGVAILTVDAPPVNALSHAVRSGIVAQLAAAIADEQVSAIVLICAGRTFFAGADITEFGAPMQAPTLPDVIDAIEASPKPVIAAIHGTALGGGLETALGCHWRIAVPEARVGLPEVNLGILPGAGGTQRLPRLVGAAAALDIMTGGRPIPALKARELGIIDAIADEPLLPAALAFAGRIRAGGEPLRRIRDSDAKLLADRADPALFDAYLAKNARAFKGFLAPGRIVEAVRAAVNLPFAQGLMRERELFFELVASRESQAQRHVFFAERATARIPDIAADTPTLPIRTVGVIGAGTMGGGIAMNFLNIGMPVVLVEAAAENLERGVSVMRRNYEATAKKGRISAADVAGRMGQLSPTVDFAALAGCDLIIEAVYENLDLKKEIFARLDKIAGEHAILATNTSFLDVDAIAAATGRPEQVVGLHFFSPANVMRLLEVVRGARTAPAVLATAMRLARTIDKIPVLSRVCDGFIANRIMARRSRQAERLVLEGVRPADIDRVAMSYGFAMGPFAMMDLVGIDVLGREIAKAGEPSVVGSLFLADRWGQKNGRGFYEYDEQRRASPSPAAQAIIEGLAAELGIAAAPVSDEDILARLLYPVVNEGAKLIEEGIALRPGDIDIAMVYGYGWPVYTGGPMFWGETIGLAAIVAALERFQPSLGADFTISPLLQQLARDGASLGDA